MKKLTLLLVLALALSLVACTVTDIEEKQVDDVKTETATPSDMEEPEAPELPWADGPVETPMIPPQYIEETELPEESEEPAEAVEPEVTTQPDLNEEPELDDKELPILQIVPEENETPPIPLN